MSYTYDTLKADIIANMEEDSAEFEAAIPSIISRAQSYVQRRCDAVQIIRITQVSASAGRRLTPLPDDVRIVKSMKAIVSSTDYNLLQQTNEYIAEYWPVATDTGIPKYWAAYDNTRVFLAPSPVSGCELSIEYVAEVTALTSTATSNWFSENAGSAFFAASMMYANMWSKNKSAISEWKVVADEELASINNEARRARRSDTSDRSQGTPENNIADGAR
jgi:hypothetical protein